MSPEVAALIGWIRVCLWIAAICAATFPLLYLFSPWFKSTLGRMLMLQSLSYAAALGATLLFQYWTPSSLYVLFWTNAAVFTLSAVATAGLTFVLWRSNYRNRKRIKEFINNEQ